METVAVSIGYGDILCSICPVSGAYPYTSYVSVVGGIDSLVLSAAPLVFRFSEICVAPENVTVVNADDVVPENLNRGLLYDCPTQIVDH